MGAACRPGMCADAYADVDAGVGAYADECLLSEVVSWFPAAEIAPGKSGTVCSIPHVINLGLKHKGNAQS